MDDLLQGAVDTVEISAGDQTFVASTKPIDYGRGMEGTVVLIQDVTGIKRREEELSLVQEIVNRIFRHNIRNELTVVTGHSDIIQSTSETQQVHKSAAMIEESATKLADHAEKARLIDRVVDNADERIEHDVPDLVGQALDECRDAHPDATISVSIECDDASITAVREAHKAITNAIENSIEHNDDVAVTVRCERASERQVRIEVADNGSGIPETELETVEQSGETDLQHCSGVGLWVMRWVTEVSNGELHIENTETGATVELVFQSASDQ